MTRLSKTTIAALLLAAAIACQQQQVTPTQEQLGEANRTILANARKSEDAEKESKGVGLWQTQEQTDTYDGQKSIQIWQPLYITGAGSGPGFDFVVGFRQGRPRGAWINVTCIIEGSSPSYSHERKVRYKFDDGKTGANIWTISDKRKQMQLLSPTFVAELLKYTRLTMEIGCDQDDNNDTVVVLTGLRNAMDAAGVKALQTTSHSVAQMGSHLPAGLSSAPPPCVEPSTHPPLDPGKAILRNGFRIAYKRKQEIGSVTRLYIEEGACAFVDIPTDEVDHFE